VVVLVVVVASRSTAPKIASTTEIAFQSKYSHTETTLLQNIKPNVIRSYDERTDSRGEEVPSSRSSRRLLQYVAQTTEREGGRHQGWQGDIRPAHMDCA